MMELYKINNDIANLKKDIIKTMKKEDTIKFKLFKDALIKNSFPYYDNKYEDLIINGRNDDIDNDKINLIAKYMNIDETYNYYYLVSSYLELFNNDYDNIFEIRQERRLLEIKYDEMINMKNELEIVINNNKEKKEIIINGIKMSIIYLMIIIIYVYMQWK
jgi:hypothetical protein